MTTATEARCKLTGAEPGPALPGDFAVYGMRVRSALELTGWPAIERAGEPDLAIDRVPLDGPGMPEEPYAARSIVDRGELALAVGGVARYRARDGAVIEVDPARGARVEDVSLYLQGVVLGAILHQRGVFPLHAGCVSIGGIGVAIAGASGAGKSTLVTELVRRGAGFVADDASVLAELPDGGLGVWPGAPRVKLAPGAIARLGRSARGLAPAGGGGAKLQLPVGRPPGADPVPLRLVYLLKAGAADALRTEAVSGLDAVSALIEETYFLSYAVALGGRRRCFRWAGAVADAVAVRRVYRPWGMDHVGAAADLILGEAAAEAA